MWSTSVMTTIMSCLQFPYVMMSIQVPALATLVKIANSASKYSMNISHLSRMEGLPRTVARNRLCPVY